MDKKKFIKPIIVILLSVFVIMLSIRSLKEKTPKYSKLDKTIKEYEQVLVNKESYQDSSLYMNLMVEEKETYTLFTFSSMAIDLEDVIILISNKDVCVSYGIKDSVGSDFVIDNFDQLNGRVKGAKIIFDKSEEYYVYLSYIVNDEIVEEYIYIN